MVDHLDENDRNKIRNLYNQRYHETGKSVQTVGWGSVTDQKLRFEKLTIGLDLKNKRILDVGCGLGDFVPFLREKLGENFFYHGIDISEDLVSSAINEWNDENIKFEVSDIHDLKEKDFDISILSGALSYKISDNENYARSCIERMFQISRVAISLNFLTSHVDYKLDKNYHYNPSEIFNFAKGLTKYVNLIHDYKLWEFTIQLFKQAKNC